MMFVFTMSGYLIQISIVWLILLYAAGCDLRHRKVSNTVTYSLCFLLAPLIINNLDVITFIQLAAAFTYIVLYFIQGRRQWIGGADLKVLVPVTLSMAINPWLVFMVVLGISMGLLHLQYGKHAPLFPAIAAAYFISHAVPLIIFLLQAPPAGALGF